MTEWFTARNIFIAILAIAFIGLIVHQFIRFSKGGGAKSGHRKAEQKKEPEQKDDKSSSSKSEPSKGGGFKKFWGSLAGIIKILIGIVALALVVYLAYLAITGIINFYNREINKSPAEIAATGMRDRTPRGATNECPPFSADGATCEVPPTCRWVQNAPGSSRELAHQWLPASSTPEEFQRTYRKIRYLDEQGIAHEWTPGVILPATPVVAWEFCPKQTITMTYSLATPRS